MIKALPKKWLIAGAAILAVLAVASGTQGSSFAGVDGKSLTDTNVGFADTGPGPTPIVEPDPDFKSDLNGARFTTSGWRTDFSRHTVAFDEILSAGVGRDGIPPVDFPRFQSIADAEAMMNPLEPVVTFKVNGEARAYRLSILTWHEVLNDVVGGVQISVTFCPLCNTAIAFKRTIDGRVFDFGVSGNLRKSDLIIWDRQTQT